MCSRVGYVLVVVFKGVSVDLYEAADIGEGAVAAVADGIEDLAGFLSGEAGYDDP